MLCVSPPADSDIRHSTIFGEMSSAGRMKTCVKPQVLNLTWKLPEIQFT